MLDILEPERRHYAVVVVPLLSLMGDMRLKYESRGVDLVMVTQQSNMIESDIDGFDFIECFTTTFLRAHSWLNWVDEDDDEHDEVGLKEKPEDTRYIKKITSK